MQIPITFKPDDCDLNSLVYPSCDYCATDQNRILFSSIDKRFKQTPRTIFNVVRCKNCGLVYLSPRPSKTRIADYYPSQFYDSREDALKEKQYILESRFVGKPEGRKLLDIGCANGGFVRFMRNKGWAADGTDVIETKGQANDSNIFIGQIDEIGLKEACYDVVTAWAVMEHVHSPTLYFSTIFKLLKPNGRFIFLVPNFNSIASRVFQDEDVPRHLHFFTRKTLSNYASKCKFKTPPEYCPDNDIYCRNSSGWFVRPMLYRFVRNRIQSRNKLFRRAMRIADIVGGKLDICFHTLKIESRLGIQGSLIITFTKA